MGAVTVVFYCDEEGCPALEWLKRLSGRAYAKGIIRIERLSELGHGLRRPEADYLRDDIYELRWRLGHINYRILYFFYRREVVVLAHGITKEERVPDRDIDLAAKRKVNYFENPEEHIYYEELK